MAETSELKVKITGDATSALGALNQFSKQVEGTASHVDGIAGKLGALLSGIQAPLAALTGVIGGGALMQSAINETVNWTKEANKLSKALGITTQEASVLNLAVGDIYGSLDEFLPAMGKLVKTIASDEDAFKRLGVSTRDAQGNLRPMTEIMTDTNAALLKLKAGTDRNVEGVRIYGKSWAEASKFLALTPQVMQEAKDKAEKLNLVVGSDSVEATKRYRASMNDLDDTAKGLKIRLGNELLPTVTDLNEAMTEVGPVATTVLGGVLKGVAQVVDAIVSGLKMAFIYLGALVRGMVDAIAVPMATVWGFLSGGVKDAKQAFDSSTRDMKSNWQGFMGELDKTSLAFTQREMVRWGDLANPKKLASGTGGDGGRSGKEKEKEKENRHAEEMNRLRQDGLKYLQDELLATREKSELSGVLLSYEKEMEAIKDKTKAQGWSLAQRTQAETQVALNAGDAWASITRKFALEREKLETELQAKLQAQEEGGLTQRLEAVRKTFAQIREEATKLGKDAGFFAIISGAEQEAKRRAFIDQVKQDLSALKTEMAQAAETMGRALTLGEKLEILGRYTRERGTKASAAEQFKDENNLNKPGYGGLRAGLDEFTKTGSMTWKDWKDLGLNAINSVTNAFAGGIKGLITGQMTLKEALTSIWRNIGNAILDVLAQIIAKFLVINMLKFAMTGTTMGFSEFMGFASGGIVTAPTLALIGEGGQPEIVAPQSDFVDWARGFANAGYNLASNIAASERQTSRYGMQAADYARSASEAMANPSDRHLVVNDMRGAVVVADERTLADLHGRGRKALGRISG
jgi:SLT domain-containing protein